MRILRPAVPQSLEEAREIYQLLQAENEALRARLEELSVQVQELLGKSSRNSSKPPSSDTTAQRAKRPKKKPSSKNRGAQPGHKARQRALLDESEVDGIK